MFATTILGVTLSAMVWALLVMLWILLAFWPAMIAKSKGRSFLLYFLLSIPFWWIMLFVALFMPPKGGAAAPTQTPPPAA